MGESTVNMSNQPTPTALTSTFANLMLDNDTTAPSPKPRKTKKDKNIFSFEELPGEIKNMIYNYCANWNSPVYAIEQLYDQEQNLDLSQELSRIAASPKGRKKNRDHLKRLFQEELRERRRKSARGSTPTILLINKQITREALSLMHEAPSLSITAKCLKLKYLGGQDLSFKDFFGTISVSLNGNALSPRPNLQELSIEFPDVWQCQTKEEVEKIFTNVDEMFGLFYEVVTYPDPDDPDGPQVRSFFWLNSLEKLTVGVQGRLEMTEVKPSSEVLGSLQKLWYTDRDLILNRHGGPSHRPKWWIDRLYQGITNIVDDNCIIDAL